MSNLLLHIPHSSIIIPFRDGFVVETSVIENEVLLLTDWYTDEIFQLKDTARVVAEFSRIFCDVERFPDDNDEPMAASGMGVIYEKTDDGSDLRNVTPELKARILKEYYFPHHQKLTDAVAMQLKEIGSALIIDCHSFSDKPFRRDLIKNQPRPDFNIGTDNFHTPPDLTILAKEYFESKGCTIGINTPYSGTIVPLTFYRKNKNVHSIMLEVDRRLYLKEGTNEKSENFGNLCGIVNGFLKVLDLYK
jgi:N-formylglutamate deformylase